MKRCDLNRMTFTFLIVAFSCLIHANLSTMELFDMLRINFRRDKYNDINHNPPDTTFKCYNLYNDLHCEYHDIYFDGKSFYARTDNYKDIPRVMINPLNFTPYWKPKHIKESTINKISSKIRKKLSFIIEIPYGDNMGHVTLDNIYPIHLKLELLHLNRDSAFDIYSNQRQYTNMPNPVKRSFTTRFQGVFTTFSKGELYDCDPVVGTSQQYEELVLVKHLYAGVGKMGQRYLNQNYCMLGVKEFNLVSKFRDRFYDTYEVNRSVPKDLIMLVDNKRFDDKGSFIRLAQVLKNKYPSYSVKFVNFAKYSFRNQLKLIARTIFYVSGPGTALTSHVFLQDRTYLYNIGVLAVPPTLYDRYLEEYLAESTPWIQPFYYFDNPRATSVNFNLLGKELSHIIETHIITNNFTRNVSEHGSGLSFIGKKFIHYCSMFGNFCDDYFYYMYAKREHGEGCPAWCAWAESILKNSCDSNHKQCPYPFKIPFKCNENFDCQLV